MADYEATWNDPQNGKANKIQIVYSDSPTASPQTVIVDDIPIGQESAVIEDAEPGIYAVRGVNTDTTPETVGPISNVVEIEESGNGDPSWTTVYEDDFSGSPNGTLITEHDSGWVDASTEDGGFRIRQSSDSYGGDPYCSAISHQAVNRAVRHIGSLDSIRVRCLAGASDTSVSWGSSSSDRIHIYLGCDEEGNNGIIFYHRSTGSVVTGIDPIPDTEGLNAPRYWFDVSYRRSTNTVRVRIYESDKTTLLVDTGDEVIDVGAGTGIGEYIAIRTSTIHYGFDDMIIEVSD